MHSAAKIFFYHLENEIVKSFSLILLLLISWTRYFCDYSLTSSHSLLVCSSIFWTIHFFEFPPRLSANHMCVIAALANHSIGWKDLLRFSWQYNKKSFGLYKKNYFNHLFVDNKIFQHRKLFKNLQLLFYTYNLYNQEVS